MNKFILSQTSVYRLHRLANKVRAITGVRHKLSDDSGLIDLIQACTLSNNTQVKWQFAEFVESLSNDQKNELLAKGINFSQRKVG